VLDRATQAPLRSLTRSGFARRQLDSWSWSRRSATRLSHLTSIAADHPIEVRPHRFGA
jgi:hypothetical protein